MNCPTCNVNSPRPHGTFGRSKTLRFRCRQCGRTFSEKSFKLVSESNIPTDALLKALQCLLEGMSIRSTERLTGINRDTIMRLLSIAGERCERLLEDKIRDLRVSDVQCDEMWGFVGCREKAKTEDHPSTFGDAYCFVAIERKSKLILAWHLGRRNARDTVAFTEKIDAATSGRFQITTDGFQAYEEAIHYSLGTRVDFAQLIKVYASPTDGEHRYSPPEVVSAIHVPRIGLPAPHRISTSHIERQNLTMRMCIRRLTRLTNGFSKKWVNLKAALALYFAYYNFCRVHMTLRVTPAMEHGLTDHIWTIGELLAQH